MKRLFPIALLTAAIGAVLSATPAAAQVTGNARATHAQTPLVQDYDRMQEYTASAADPVNAGCSVIHDFNTSQTHPAYIAVCPFFPFP
jgi:hypothetical protein